MDCYHGILSRLSTFIFLHPGFIKMFQEYAPEWKDTLSKRLALVPNNEYHLGVWKNILTMVPHDIVVNHLCNDQPKPFLPYYQMLREQGVSLQTMLPILKKADEHNDHELLHWMVNHETEEHIPYISPFVDHLIVQRNVTLLTHHLMEPCLQKVICNYSSFFPVMKREII